MKKWRWTSHIADNSFMMRFLVHYMMPGVLQLISFGFLAAAMRSTHDETWLMVLSNMSSVMKLILKAFYEHVVVKIFASK